MSNLVKILCMAEAEGELDPPTEPSYRKYWVHPINSVRRSDERFDIFFDNLKKYPDKFFNYYRMSILSFEDLLEKVRQYLSKQNTTFRNSISAEKRLTVTIR